MSSRHFPGFFGQERDKTHIPSCAEYTGLHSFKAWPLFHVQLKNAGKMR
jgi:hypothetical protein